MRRAAESFQRALDYDPDYEPPPTRSRSTTVLTVAVAAVSALLLAALAVMVVGVVLCALTTSLHSASRTVVLSNVHSYGGAMIIPLVPFLLNRKEEITVEPFRLRFDRLEYWPRPRIASLVAATVPPELERLVVTLNGVLEDYNIPVEDRTYRPHITAVRRARQFETQRLAQPARSAHWVSSWPSTSAASRSM